MLHKIKRSVALYKYPKFPLSDHVKEEYFFPKTFKNYTLVVDYKSTRGLIKSLAIEFTQLIHNLNFDSLIFLGDLKCPLYRDHNYKPVKRALEYFQANKVGKTFNGAIEVDLKELNEFTRHLYWLIRTNAACPIIHFIDNKQNVLGSIHYSGDLLIRTLNRKTDRRFLESVENTNFKFQL